MRQRLRKKSFVEMTLSFPARGNGSTSGTLLFTSKTWPRTQSDGKHVKGRLIVSKPFISLFYKFQAFSAYLNRSEMYVIR